MHKKCSIINSKFVLNHNYLFQLAPFTSDVIHLIFTCCGADMMSDWTELLNDYYDYIKVSSLATYSCSQVYPAHIGSHTCCYMTHPNSDCTAICPLALTQGYLSTHALDRNNMGLCFDTYWDAVSKVIITTAKN